MFFELIDIVRHFGEVKALDGVSLKVEEGEVLGLVGPNGSGKSTLLKIMLGILRPTSGRLLVNGRELDERGWQEFRKRIGYMPERVSFYDNLTGRETLRLFARVKGCCSLDSTEDIVRRIVLEDALDRKVGGYSKGMRQRLNLAQAIINDPDLLVLDEHTSGLDPVGTREFYEILDAVRARKQLTVILSSHILAEIEEKIDRVAIIKNGGIKAIGSLEELYTGLRLPLKITVSLNGRDAALEELLGREGASGISYRDGFLHASVPREDKLRVLSVLMALEGRFADLSIREPNLEEVFFGVH